MTLPTFVGIGAERCGSTWLHTLLNQHPRIYVPLRRKELNFFNQFYDEGLEWYESFFPNNQDELAYQAIGEVSPSYLNLPTCAKKMASIKSIKKLFAILRNPVDRSYSHYGYIIRLSGYRKSFEEFLLDYPDTITHGFYAEHLEYFLEYYSRSQLCCLIYEDAVSDVVSTKKNIAQFLEVEFHEFPEAAGLEKVNETYIPKLKKLNQFSSWMRNYLRKSNLDFVVNTAKIMGLQKVLKIGANQGLPPMTVETRLRLQDIFAEDTENLEKLLDINLNLWRFQSFVQL